MTAALSSPGPPWQPFCICDEFLAPNEAKLMVDGAVAGADAYEPARTMEDPGREHASAHRRSTVRYDEPSSMALFAARLVAFADAICERLRIRPLPVTHLETQLVCTGHGEYYRPHTDDGNERLRSRRVTCLYYLHREPRAFDGGELRLHVPPMVAGEQPTYVDVAPEQNRLVAFPSGLVHEVRPVSVPTNRFEDRRFALSAWLHA